MDYRRWMSIADRERGSSIAIVVDLDWRCIGQYTGRTPLQQLRGARENLLACLQQPVGHGSSIRGALIRDPIGKRLCQHLRGGFGVIARGRPQGLDLALHIGNVERNSASEPIVDWRHINITRLQSGQLRRPGQLPAPCLESLQRDVDLAGRQLCFRQTDITTCQNLWHVLSDICATWRGSPKRAGRHCGAVEVAFDCLRLELFSQ